jgi:hypothetical protein
MPDKDREIVGLLIDYADALRDGYIPAFLKSLTRTEAQRISSSSEFWDATEMVRVLNGVGFADKAVIPDVGLFISRVDAEIASRLKQSKASTRSKHTRHTKPVSRADIKDEKSI